MPVAVLADAVVEMLEVDDGLNDHLVGCDVLVKGATGKAHRQVEHYQQEGWRLTKAKLRTDIQDLKEDVDPGADLSFNVHLTEAQMLRKEQVQLPYVQMRNHLELNYEYEEEDYLDDDLDI